MSFFEQYEDIRANANSDGVRRTIDALRLRLSSKPFVLYGAGGIGVTIAKSLIRLDLYPVCFCDKNKLGVEPETGLNIISPDKLLQGGGIYGNCLL
jgi:hypothetical protein